MSAQLVLHTIGGSSTRRPMVVSLSRSEQSPQSQQKTEVPVRPISKIYYQSKFEKIKVVRGFRTIGTVLSMVTLLYLASRKIQTEQNAQPQLNADVPVRPIQKIHYQQKFLKINQKFNQSGQFVSVDTSITVKLSTINVYLLKRANIMFPQVVLHKIGVEFNQKFTGDVFNKLR